MFYCDECAVEVSSPKDYQFIGGGVLCEKHVKEFYGAEVSEIESRTDKGLDPVKSELDFALSRVRAKGINGLVGWLATMPAERLGRLIYEIRQDHRAWRDLLAGEMAMYYARNVPECRATTYNLMGVIFQPGCDEVSQ